MLILGIDPGTAQTGYGVIRCYRQEVKLVKHGTIKTSVNDHAPQRLDSIYRQVSKLLQQYKPQVLAMESLFFNLIQMGVYCI